MMIYMPHSIGLIIAASPKCASTSISNEFHVPGLKSLDIKTVAGLREVFWEVVGVVRNPIDRFESAYNFFKYGQCGNFPTGKYQNINEFTDAVLSGIPNEHWTPQSDLLLECDRFVDLESFPLSRRENGVIHKEKATYRLKDLKEFYANDYKIRGFQWQ